MVVRRRKPRPTRAQVILALLIVFVALPAMVAYDFFSRYPKTGGGSGASETVTIPRGARPGDIARILHEKGVIANPTKFQLWLRLSGRFSGIRAGTFSLQPGMSPEQISEILSGNGIHLGIRVTVPEGRTLDEVAEILSRQNLIRSDVFLAAAVDATLLKSLGIPGNSAEGFLFPDTYYFEEGVTAQKVIRVMHDRFNAQLDTLGVQNRSDRFDRLILASIVEAEAKIPSDAPIIAGLYLNRLDRAKFPSRRLQADPTVAYGCSPLVKPQPPSCSTFKGVLGRKQLDDDANLYNTYRREGLPPGPICAPSLNSLKAAFFPTDVPYLYFVAGADGSHRFATTLEEHNANVEKYRQGL